MSARFMSNLYYLLLFFLIISKVVRDKAAISYDFIHSIFISQNIFITRTFSKFQSSCLILFFCNNTVLLVFFLMSSAVLPMIIQSLFVFKTSYKLICTLCRSTSSAIFTNINTSAVYRYPPLFILIIAHSRAFTRGK